MNYKKAHGHLAQENKYSKKYYFVHVAPLKVTLHETYIVHSASWRAHMLMLLDAACIRMEIQWNLGSRMPLITNKLVYEQIFQKKKKVSGDERCLE
jgi:hypothetical protein